MPILFALLAGIGWAQEEPLTAGDLPVRVGIPDGWEGEVLAEDPPQISLQRRRPPAFVGVAWSKGLQPALERVDVDAYGALLQGEFSASGEIALRDLTAERVEREDLGTTILYRASGSAEGIELEMLFASFTVESGGAHVSVGARTQEDASEALEEVLAELSIIRPPLSDADLGFGGYTGDVGFSIDLPPTMRAVTSDELGISDGLQLIESGQHQGAKKLALFVDPADLDGRKVFTCTAGSVPIEVLDPAKSPPHAANFRNRVRSLVSGGALHFESSGRDMRTDTRLLGGTAYIEATEEGDLALIDLGDREAYLWRVPAKDGELEMTILALYTAWDSIGLDCAYYAQDPEDPFLTEVEASLRSIRITDGAEHRMRLSVSAQYIKLWPWTHPMLQVWWFGAVFFGLGIVGTLWTLRS